MAAITRGNEKLDAATLTAILDAVNADRSITALHLTRAGLTPNLAVQLADFLEQNATLTHVDLTGNPIGAHGAACLAASLAKNRRNRLSSLTLANCGLKNESLAPWTEFFRNEVNPSTKKLTQLKCVSCFVLPSLLLVLQMLDDLKCFYLLSAG